MYAAPLVVVGSIPDKVVYIPDFVIYTIDDDGSGNNIASSVFDVNDITDIKESTSRAIRLSNQLHIKSAKFLGNNIVTHDNDILTNLKLLFSWNRKYVRINNMWCDLDDDVFMDAIATAGVSPGGILNGEFYWAKIKNKCKLIRKDSKIESALKEFISSSQLSRVKKRDLEVGAIYETDRKKMAIFLGYVDTIQQNPKAGKAWSEINFDFDSILRKKYMLFFDFNKYESIENNVKSFFNHMMKNPNDIVATQYFGYNNPFSIVNAHKYVNKIDTVDIGNMDAAEILRKMNLTYTHALINQITSSGNKGYPNLSSLQYHMSGNSKYMYAVQHTQQLPKTINVKNYINFI